MNRLHSFTDEIRTLERYSVNPKGLSILSFRRNFVGRNESEWVDRLFGPSAIFNATDEINCPKLPELREMFRAASNLKLPAKKAACSFELLGFIGIDRDEPFMLTSKVGPQLLAGEATLVTRQFSKRWKCYYRCMTEKWRNSYTHWPVFFYCPASSDDICNSSNEMNPTTYIDGIISITANESSWRANFTVLPSAVSNVIKDVKSSKPAVCLAVPYSSSDRRKKMVSGAMIFEWVRYYSLLGFKVFIYDFNGANRKAIFNSPYALSQKQQGKNWIMNVVYHPFTVMGLMSKHKNMSVAEFNPEVTPLGQENREDHLTILETFDSDKVATLTHCRFEASAVGGHDDVLVADYDEFFYCPLATTTFRSQRYFTQNLISKYKGSGLGAIIIYQMWMSYKRNDGKYALPLDCLFDKVQNKTSIFECYAGMEYNLGFSFIGKSLHLGHKCPLTDFHSSCHSSDCECTSIYPGAHDSHALMPYEDRCYLIHLTTDPTDYKYRNVTDDVRTKIENATSELSSIISTTNDIKVFYPLWDQP